MRTGRRVTLDALVYYLLIAHQTGIGPYDVGDDNRSNINT